MKSISHCDKRDYYVPGRCLSGEWNSIWLLRPELTRLMLVVSNWDLIGLCGTLGDHLVVVVHCGPLRGVHGALGLLLRNRAGQPKHDPEPHFQPPELTRGMTPTE